MVLVVAKSGNVAAVKEKVLGTISTRAGQTLQRPLAAAAALKHSGPIIALSQGVPGWLFKKCT